MSARETQSTFAEKIAAAAAGPVFAGVTSGAGGGGGGLNGLALLLAGTLAQLALCLGMVCGDKAASEAVRFTNFVGVLSIAGGLASFILSYRELVCKRFEQLYKKCLGLSRGF